MLAQNMQRQQTPQSSAFIQKGRSVNHGITKATESTILIRYDRFCWAAWSVNKLKGMLSLMLWWVWQLFTYCISHTQISNISCSRCQWEMRSRGIWPYCSILEVPAAIFMWHYGHKNRQSLLSHDFISTSAGFFIESLRLEKTTKIIKSNHQTITTTPTDHIPQHHIFAAGQTLLTTNLLSNKDRIWANYL